MVCTIVHESIMSVQKCAQQCETSSAGVRILANSAYYGISLLYKQDYQVSTLVHTGVQ